MPDEFEQRMERLARIIRTAESTGGIEIVISREHALAILTAYREKCEESDREHKEKLGVVSVLDDTIADRDRLKARAGELQKANEMLAAEAGIFYSDIRKATDALFNAVQRGVYDSRSIVGDETLRLHCSLEQFKELQFKPAALARATNTQEAKGDE